MNFLTRILKFWRDAHPEITVRAWQAGASLVLALTMQTAIAAPPQTDADHAAFILAGDVNDDGRTDVEDAVLAVKAQAGTLRLRTARSLIAADLAEPRGKLDEKDVQAVLIRALRIVSPESMPLPARFIHPVDGAEMALVPAGSFVMGSNKSFAERPVHTVSLTAYYIDVTETTYGRYRRFMSATRYKPEGDWLLPDFSEGEDYPVASVTWDDAAAYAAWTGKQLPTEAQWEKAARGTDARAYPWGNTLDGTLANWYGNHPISALPVGSFPDGASPYGILDMAGNVWEWVADYFDERYYTDSPETDPSGPATGYDRVMRGGGWNTGDLGWEIRSAFRYGCSPNSWGDVMGFRCAVPLDQPRGRETP